jgi:ketosteroid isomerase-like protein/catechol 2,3-dioxygenase-like lactoylglutathione lyase family enzyme/predicted enzyme related to lactoylglutathione lyase
MQAHRMLEETEKSYRLGGVKFKRKHIASCRASTDDARAIVHTILALHDAWIRQDIDGYLAMSTADVTRLSQQSGEIQFGHAEVRKRLPEEWRAFERGAAIDMNMRIKRLELAVDGDTATAIYEVEVSGGKRWDFDDHALYFQAFVRTGDGWKLTYQTDSWNLDFDADGAANAAVEFDYVYPVRDLRRALAFYQPLLGEPEFVSDMRAGFNLGGARFFLDAGNLHGYARIQQGLPNGYAEVHVQDLRAEMTQWQRSGVVFLTKVEARGSDIYALAQDPAGNVFVLVERNVSTSETQATVAPTISVEAGAPRDILFAVEGLMGAWLCMDEHALAAKANTNIRWFDDSRCKTRRIGTGVKSIRWEGYDRSSAGLMAKMDIAELRVKPLGSRQIVSYQMTLAGTGPHPFRERSMVTQLFEGGRATQSFIVSSEAARAHVLSLDYVAYPVPKLRACEDFYTGVMRFGKPYRDEDWRGYWSSASVFGIYVASPADDGLPRAGQTNGYASFWIKSAQETYQYLRQADAAFPLIEAISNRSGIDREDGYTQIYATDSEGNGVVFTEYPADTDAEDA